MTYDNVHVSIYIMSSILDNLKIVSLTLFKADNFKKCRKVENPKFLTNISKYFRDNCGLGDFSVWFLYQQGNFFG